MLRRFADLAAPSPIIYPKTAKRPFSGLMPHKSPFHREGLAMIRYSHWVVESETAEFKIPSQPDPKKIINPAVHHKRMPVVCHHRPVIGVVHIKVRQIASIGQGRY